MAGEEENEKKTTEAGESKSENGIEIEADAAADREEVKEKEEKGMKPWEQHAAVISIPRFDYNAPSALSNHSHSGFLITCSIKREKSATKEAISILDKYTRSCDSCDSKTSECTESFDASQGNKRRKTLKDETGGLDDEGLKGDSSNEDTANDRTEETGFSLSLVKLTKSGLLLLTCAGKNSPHTIDIVSDIFQRLESGNLKSPQWCHRIFPIQATCQLNEKELRSVVSKLVLQFMNNKQEKLAQPLKFAVGYNRRGLEETQGKAAKKASVDSNICPLLDRNKCFEIVASAVKDVISDSAVDLKSPEVSVLVELLPLSGVPNGSLVAAVSVLPQNLVSVKPRLCIKPMVSDTNFKNAKR
ncbi:hypothetical protein M5689_015062 [Euphorbia peplus]|nr:hypothetical protein M5689_015062 [Euphorbia peplus]